LRHGPFVLKIIIPASPSRRREALPIMPYRGKSVIGTNYAQGASMTMSAAEQLRASWKGDRHGAMWFDRIRGGLAPHKMASSV
jgi:hypothetical protein